MEPYLNIIKILFKYTTALGKNYTMHMLFVETWNLVTKIRTVQGRTVKQN